MKIFNKILTLAIIALFFASCSDDDKEIPLQDKSEIIGTQTGNVQVSLAQGNFSPYSGTATSNFIRTTQEDKLNLFLQGEYDLGGPIEASNFLIKNDDLYTFALANYSVTFNGNEIAAYVRDWYPIYNFARVEFKDLKCIEGAYFNRKTQAINFTYEGEFIGYEEDTSTPGQLTSVANNRIILVYTDLKR